MHSGAIKRILKVKKKIWTRKLMMVEKKSLYDKTLEINVAISQKKIVS